MIDIQKISILIFLFPFLGAILLPFLKNSRRLLQGISAVILAGAAFMSIQGLAAVKGGSVLAYHFGGWQPPFGIEWRLDSLSALMAVLITSIALIGILATGATVQRSITANRTVYYITALLHVSSLLGIVLTHDLFNLFVFIEVSSLTAYALIATGDDFRGNVSSLRYLLVGTVGASFYLLGVGYLYAATGTLNMSDLAARIPEIAASKNVLMGVLFILLGLCIKMGLFPFHSWLPDAYTYASDSATALIAPLMTKTAIYALIRIFFLVLGFPFLESYGIPKILMAMGALAMIAGSLMAFSQTDFKRMLAYSSISHIGLIVAGLSLNNPMAFTGAIMHIVNHAVMKTALFLIAAAAFERHGVRNIFDFSKLRGKMPFTLAAFSAAALSMTGIPPFCGFFSKWYILVGAFQAGQPLMAALIVISSLLTGLYFFKVIEKVFFQNREEPGPVMAEGPFPLVFSVSLIAVGLFALGLFSPAIFHWGMEVLIPKGL